MPHRRSLSDRIARKGIRLAGSGMTIGRPADQPHQQREDRVSETPEPYAPDAQTVEENRIDALRMALKRAGVDWPTIHRLDDIRYMAGPSADCPDCNEHVLLALVDRLTAALAAREGE